MKERKHHHYHKDLRSILPWLCITQLRNMLHYHSKEATNSKIFWMSKFTSPVS